MCIIITAFVVLCLCKILKPVYENKLLPLITSYWSIPTRIHKIMKEQRVRGPSFVTVATNTLKKFFLQGNSIYNHDMSSINHDIVGRLLPHYATWAAKYGRTFFLSDWVKPRLCLTEAKPIKEFLFRHSPVTGNTGVGTEFFIGQRLLMKLGLDGPQRRHTLHTVFKQSKIQEWVGRMVECTEITLQKLQDRVDQPVGIEISQYVNVLTAHIMSRTEFGTTSEQGIQIAQLLNQVQELRAQSTWYSRLSQYNRELEAVLQVQVEEVLREMIQQRLDYVAIARTNSHGNDLLGTLLDEMHRKMGIINMDLIVDECKTSLFAGHEAITLLITWTIMLLACNPSWQDLVRAEVNDVCHGHPPTPHNLSKFGLLNMVIKESLRLYPPVPIIERMAFEDIRIHHNLSDDFLIPKGVSVLVPVLAMNHTEELWGRDVNEFYPQRFASINSVEARCHFFPFAAGPQHCLAQYYALMEAKIFLAMFLSKFRFTISQNYRHAPVVVTLLKPKYGLQINLTTL